MKFRKGYVSNSSSSSFLIYGVALDEEEIIEIAKKIDPKVNDGYDAGEIIEKESGLTYNSCYESYWIGKSWASIKDDQTGKQFKEEIEKEVKELGIEDECLTHQEAWFD